MNIDFRKISGKTKKVFWMDAATGKLLYVGEVSNKIHRINPDIKGGSGVNDGVLIAFDASKSYLTPEMKNIPSSSNWKNLRDLNE
jgi:hypothetical protein